MGQTIVARRVGQTLDWSTGTVQEEEAAVQFPLNQCTWKQGGFRGRPQAGYHSSEVSSFGRRHRDSGRED